MKANHLKDRIKQDFNKSAKRYGTYAKLQESCAHQLAMLAKAKKLPSLDNALDIGAGTGFIAKFLERDVLQLDIAEAMCVEAAAYGKAVVADMENVPVSDGCFDAVFSSFALQWALDLEAVLREAARVTKQNGDLFVATLGKETLKELRNSYIALFGVAPVIKFVSQAELSEDLDAAGYEIRDFRVETHLTSYENIFALLNNIKGVGGRYKQAGAAAKATRKQFETLEEAYRSRHYGSVQATWQVYYLHAVKR